MGVHVAGFEECVECWTALFILEVSIFGFETFVQVMGLPPRMEARTPLVLLRRWLTITRSRTPRPTMRHVVMTASDHARPRICSCMLCDMVDIIPLNQIV